MNKYLTAKQLADIYPFCAYTLLGIISRGEFASYRKGKPTKILYCEETKKLLDYFVAIKVKKRGNRCSM